jgi:glycosyltransferase involved in cell wall biosynthesis
MVADRMTDRIHKVSVIIPTYNRKNLLREALHSLFQQSYPKEKYEIIVVDNSSTDGTEQMITELLKKAPCGLKYFRKKNEGPAPARNLGMQCAEGSVIAFTDSDCLASPDWIEKGVQAFDADDIAFVSGKILPKPDMPVSFFSPFNYVLSEHPIYPTNNIFYRKDILDSSGGFDTRFSYPSGGEDAELAWRIKRKGWKNIFSQDLIIFHEVHRFTLLDIIFREIWRWRRIPFVVKEVPELRENLLYLRVFMSRRVPFLYLSFLGIVSAIIFGEGILLTLAAPYLYYLVKAIAPEVNGLLGIVKGLVKMNILLIADLVAAFTYAYGSIKYRSVVL